MASMSIGTQLGWAASFDTQPAHCGARELQLAAVEIDLIDDDPEAQLHAGGCVL